MESQSNCLECGLKISNKNYAISRHVKKKHDITFYEYVKKNYKLVRGKLEECGFCNEIALPNYRINHINLTYEINYDNGFSCGKQECKNKISLEILGCEYDSKKFEKIGSRAEYLSKLYKIEIKEANSLKYRTPKVKFRCSLENFISKYGESEGKRRYQKRIDEISKNSPKTRFSCSIQNFIKRYGLEIGTKKYNDRCEKISYTSSLDFFINKYGEDKGNLVWKNKFKMNRTSDKSKIISEILSKLNIRYEIEKNIGSKFVDYFLTDYNIAIEYFGDYWHANPKIYESNFFIKQIKMNAYEVWEKDKIRIDFIKNKIDSIIIIWESTQISKELIEKTINDIKDKKITIYL